MLNRLVRFRRRLVEFSATHPRFVVGLALLITVAFGLQFPKIRIDTDPKNMLPETSQVRRYNDQVEGWFGLHPDVIVVGIRNEGGLFNPESLRRIERITDEILKLPGVVARDVVSLPTVDDVTVEGETLRAQPLLGRVPEGAEELDALRKRIAGNTVVIGRLVSADGTVSAIYVPIEKGANGKVVADRIREIVAAEMGPERYFLAGDPVARDTFGIEMFRQMAWFSPLAGMVMMAALYVMFRSATLVIANMGVAMIAIVWAMGLFIGLGIPIHIMASMSPVFLMAISTDTVHIFNEFYFRHKDVRDKRQAILETMEATATPITYSDLTTAAGFASLAVGPIVPVKIFGLLVGFGTIVILLMSFTLVPALMSLMKEERIERMNVRIDPGGAVSRWLYAAGRFAITRKTVVVLAGVVLIAVSVVGIARIRVNNNMIHWFKTGSEVRKADRVLNEKMGGTATLYMVADAKEEGGIADPRVLRSLERLQKEIERQYPVGKTVSVVDYVKRVNRVLNDDDPAHETVPDSRETIGQYLLLFNMAAKPRDLNNVIDYPYTKANVIVQLKSWDAVDTKALLENVRADLRANPVPGVEIRPAGIAYFNMVWNDDVLWGMLSGFIASCVFVLFLMVLAYRSFWWGIVSSIPLVFTIVLIYGVVGFIGKDFDMPISVLSTLSLGLAVDFAIHFASRFRQRYAETNDVKEALLWTVARPGKGILRNAVLFASGFAVMIFAALTPYITVGAFMIAIMLLSAAATILFLPSLVALFPGRL
ncbi:MAG: MMPL family transporter, partial [Deltaproteobacteria bacterium]|nr:MMPL family transporter [Deltaproteobacteria bacterium]